MSQQPNRGVHLIMHPTGTEMTKMITPGKCLTSNIAKSYKEIVLPESR